MKAENAEQNIKKYFDTFPTVEESLSIIQQLFEEK